MFNKQNKTSLFEYSNSYRNGQGCIGTQLRHVPLQPLPLQYSFQYSDNDVLLDIITTLQGATSGILLFMRV